MILLSAVIKVNQAFTILIDSCLYVTNIFSNIADIVFNSFNYDSELYKFYQSGNSTPQAQLTKPTRTYC